MLGERGSSSILTHLTLRGLIFEVLFYCFLKKEKLRGNNFSLFWSIAAIHVGRRPPREQAREMRDIPYLRLCLSFQSIKWMGNNSVKIIVLRVSIDQYGLCREIF